ncbi:MAG: hypothetical protein MRQ09_05905 [Candidatus Midichloria sp.]|nr:hypothetical protein [Candidatus Midichloria sp.]
MHRQQQNHEGAIEFCQKAGEVFARLGKIEQVLPLWEKAFNIKPNIFQEDSKDSAAGVL